MPDPKRTGLFRRRPSVNTAELSASPLADSVRQVIPNFGVQDMSPDDWNRLGMTPTREVRGVAFTKDPVVRMNTRGQYGVRGQGDLPAAAADERRRNDERTVLLHEAGHVFQEQDGTKRFPTLANQYDEGLSLAHARAVRAIPRTANAEMREGRRARATPEERAFVDLNPYAAQDIWPAGKEGYAQAFAGAWDYLSSTAGTSKANPRQLLARYEQRVPGTGQLVMRLLKEPLFSDHPYASGFPPATEQPERSR